MTNQGVYPVDPTTTVGLVRILVGDTSAQPLNPVVSGFGDFAWYSDDELNAMSGLFNDDPRRVAIWVLSNVAISQALLLKKWSTDDLSVDGTAIAAAIEKTIARLAAEVEADDNYFDIVDTNTTSLYPHIEGMPYGYFPPVWDNWGGPWVQ